MEIKYLRGNGPHVMQRAALAAGYSMVFSRDFGQGFLSTPFDPSVAYLDEERAGRLIRLQHEDSAVGYRFSPSPTVMGHLLADATPLNLVHPYNYFHFLIEGLATVLSLVAKGAVTHKSVLVTGLLHQNMTVAFKYALRDVLPSHLQLRGLDAVTCDRVITAPQSGHAFELINGSVTNYTFDAENIRLLRSTFEPLWWERGETPAKLFIRRQTPVRRLANADRLEDIARAEGYHVLDPGTLTFKQQVELFSGATHVAGPTGAWCANLVFMREDSRVTVFYPETARAERCAWNTLGSTFNLPVRDVYGAITEERVYQPIHSDFAVSEEELRHLLSD